MWPSKQVGHQAETGQPGCSEAGLGDAAVQCRRTSISADTAEPRLFTDSEACRKSRLETTWSTSRGCRRRPTEGKLVAHAGPCWRHRHSLEPHPSPILTRPRLMGGGPVTAMDTMDLYRELAEAPSYSGATFLGDDGELVPSDPLLLPCDLTA